MIITFVIDAYGVTTNGTTVTAMRSAEALRKRGHHVNIITGTPCDDQDTYVTGVRKTPVLYPLSKSQGMPLAKVNKTLLENVIKQSDIVHFLLPFKLQKAGKKIADKYRIPTTAAFHLQPENITSTIYLAGLKRLNRMIYRKYKRFYDQFDNLHCPSAFIAEQLRTYRYTANLHIFSNGVSRLFTPKETPKPLIYKERFVLLMIGRYSREKRQDILIDAIKQSKHRNKIQLILAGQGPWENHLRKRASSLPNKPVMRFFEQNKLIDIINYADLYIHTSDTETEAIACIEAFSCGLVPIISDSPNSATKQFVLDRANVFQAGSANDLAIKIDELLDQPHRLDHLSQRYIEYAKHYTLDASIQKLEAMFIKTIREYPHSKK